MKHLLKLEDWSTEEIINTLNLADQLKYEQKHGYGCLTFQKSYQETCH